MDDKWRNRMNDHQFITLDTSLPNFIGRGGSLRSIGMTMNLGVTIMLLETEFTN